MAEPCKVLITSRRLTSPQLFEGKLRGEVLTFGESEPLRALETITLRHPEVIALDHQFATSPRGLAFIERIRNDPKLAGSDVLVVLEDGALSEVSREPADGAKGSTDQNGTRRAPRVLIRPGVQVLVDGRDATLVDLSLLGAQVLSPTAVRPNKPVRLVMPDEETLVRVTGLIVWARFEMVEAKPAYRAGISFTDPDPAAVLRYCVRQRQVPPDAGLDA